MNSPPKTTKSPTKTTNSQIKTLPQIKFSLSKRKAFKIKTFSSEREGRRLKILGEENKHTSVPSTPKDQTFKSRFLFNEKETSNGPKRREQAPKLCPQPRRPDFQVKD